MTQVIAETLPTRLNRLERDRRELVLGRMARAADPAAVDREITKLDREIADVRVAIVEAKADAYMTALVRVKIELEDELRGRRRDRAGYQAYVRWERIDRIRAAFRDLGIKLDVPAETKR